MNKSLFDTLSAYICGQILNQPSRQLDPGEALITGGLIDSFHLVDIAMFVEETYGIHLAEEEINTANFDTVEKIAALIQSHRN